MTIIEIVALPNGAHRNQSGGISKVPEGWAIVPDEMELENFPFGTVTAEEIDGVMTLTAWKPGTIPEPEPEPEPEPTTDEILLELAADHEARICMMELGV